MRMKRPWRIRWPSVLSATQGRHGNGTQDKFLSLQGVPFCPLDGDVPLDNVRITGYNDYVNYASTCSGCSYRHRGERGHPGLAAHCGFCCWTASAHVR